jgi:hypothetical protein
MLEAIGDCGRTGRSYARTDGDRRMTNLRARHLASVLAALCACQDAGATDDGWTNELTVYMVGASIDGEAGAKGVTTDVDVGFDDILDNLEMGYMVAWRTQRGRWAVVADLAYLKLEQQKDGLGLAGATRSTIDADQTIVGLDAGYAVGERLFAYAGIRYWDLGVDLQVVGGGPLGEIIAAGADESWVDPVIGLRYAVPLGARWELVAKGGVGGFGVGSDFAWETTAFAGWNLTEHASLLFGFRWFDVDYEDGSGTNRLVYDVGLGGPSAGFTWRF